MAYKEANLTLPSFEGPTPEKTAVVQETKQSEKSDAQPQETTTQTVEGVEQKTSSQENKPSEKLPAGYFAMQRENKRLKHEFGSMREQLAGLVKVIEDLRKPQVSAPVTLTSDDFWEKFKADPQGVIKTLTNGSASESAKELITKELEKRDLQIKEQNFESKRQEAKQIMLSSEFVKKDPNFFENLAQIIEDNGLDYYGEKDPVKAMQAALKLYGQNPGVPKKPLAESAPTKSQLQTLQSGGMAKNKDDKQKDNNELLLNHLLSAQKEPYLFNDPDWNSKYAKLKANAA